MLRRHSESERRTRTEPAGMASAHADARADSVARSHASASRGLILLLLFSLIFFSSFFASRAYAYRAENDSDDHPACISGGVRYCLCEVNGKQKGADSIYVRQWKKRQASYQSAIAQAHGPTPPNHREADSLVLYFEEGEFALDETDIAMIREFLIDHPGIDTVTIEGNTDQCGTVESNIELGKKRIDSAWVKVAAISRELGRRTIVRYESLNYGEQRSSRHHQFDRNVILRAGLAVGRAVPMGPGYEPSTDVPSAPLPKPPKHDILDALQANCSDATHFLIDQSGSMSSHWAEIQLFDYPLESRLFMGTVNSCSRGAGLMQVSPGGDTNIWYELFRLLELMPESGKLCFLSDFDILGTAAKPLTEGDVSAIRGILRSKKIRLECLDVTHGGAEFVGVSGIGGFRGCPK